MPISFSALSLPNGIKTHCERGRNGAVRLFHRDLLHVKWGTLQLDLSQLEECPEDTSKFMAKPEQGGKGPAARQLKAVRGKSTRTFALNMSRFDKKKKTKKPHQIYFGEALCWFSVSLPHSFWMPQRWVYKSLTRGCHQSVCWDQRQNHRADKFRAFGSFR